MPLKLCRDCRHLLGEHCGRSLMTADYVNGTPPTYYRAQTERAWPAPTGCGPAAKHFEPIAGFHDDKPDERADVAAQTVEGDLDLAGRPLRPGT